MGFSIPNDVPGGTTEQHAQATPDKVDIDIIVAGHNLTGVQSGCAVTAQGSPNMTVAVAVGTVGIAGVAAAVAAGNVTITTADGTNPRFDLVVVNSSGTKSVTAGTPAALPVFPAIPANSAVLAAVYVGAGVTSIATADIVDKRVILNSTTYVTLTGALVQQLTAPRPARVKADTTALVNTSSSAPTPIRFTDLTRMRLIIVNLSTTQTLAVGFGTIGSLTHVSEGDSVLPGQQWECGADQRPVFARFPSSAESVRVYVEMGA